MHFADFAYLVNDAVLAVLVDFVNFSDLAGLVNLLDLLDFGACVFSSCEETGCPLLLSEWSPKSEKKVRQVHNYSGQRI